MRRVVIAASVVVIVLAACVGGALLWEWLHQTSANVPPYASAAEIERRFKPQVDRLIALATDRSREAQSNYATSPADVALFAHPAILKIFVERTDTGLQHQFAGKSYDYHFRKSTKSVSASPGQAVVNRYWDDSPIGSKRTVLEYQRRLLDEGGNEVEACLLFDFDMLANLEP